MEPDVQALIDANAPYFTVLDNGKIMCTLNSHTMPARRDVLEPFIKGKKYKKIKARKEAEDEFGKYEPFISQSINFPEMLYCTLTNQLIVKTKERIKQHMKGQRFLRAKDRYLADQLELWEEPSFEELEAMEAEGAMDEEETDDAEAGDEEAGDEEASEGASGSDDEMLDLDGVQLVAGLGSSSEEEENEIGEAAAAPHPPPPRGKKAKQKEAGGQQQPAAAIKKRAAAAPPPPGEKKQPKEKVVRSKAAKEELQTKKALTRRTSGDGNGGVAAAAAAVGKKAKADAKPKIKHPAKKSRK